MTKIHVHRWKDTRSSPQERAILRGLSSRRKKLGSLVAVMLEIQQTVKRSQYGLQIMSWAGMYAPVWMNASRALINVIRVC